MLHLFIATGKRRTVFWFDVLVLSHDPCDLGVHAIPLAEGAKSRTYADCVTVMLTAGIALLVGSNQKPSSTSVICAPNQPIPNGRRLERVDQQTPEMPTGADRELHAGLEHLEAELESRDAELQRAQHLIEVQQRELEELRFLRPSDSMLNPSRVPLNCCTLRIQHNLRSLALVSLPNHAAYAPLQTPRHTAYGPLRAPAAHTPAMLPPAHAPPALPPAQLPDLPQTGVGSGDRDSWGLHVGMRNRLGHVHEPASIARVHSAQDGDEKEGLLNTIFER